MKKYFFVAGYALAGLLFYACTDNDLGSPELAEHCSDGQLNYGELDVDCGGECNSCGSLESPCNPDTNEAVFDSSLAIPFPNGTYTYTSVFGNQDGDNFEIIAYHNTMEIDIKWHGPPPTEQRVYLLGGTYYLNSFYTEGQANIRLWHQLTGNKAISASGKLYVKPIPGGKWLVTFCDVRFVSEVSTQTVVYNGISGRLLAE